MILTRRQAIGAAIGGAAVIGIPLSAKAASPALFNVTDRPLGLQLYTLGGEFASDPKALFAALAKAGYRRFECDLTRLNRPGLREAAKAHGLTCTSLHLDATAFLPEAGERFKRLVDNLTATGVRQAGLSIFPFSPKLAAGGPIQVQLTRIAAEMTEDDWKRTAALLNEKGAVLRKAGVRFFYHNHNCEFRPLGKTTPFQLLMQHTDPAIVDFQLDAGWVGAAGLDPIKVLAQHPGRFRLMHVKDITAATVPNYAFEMAPATIGSGTLDWPRIIPAARKAGITEFFVEQEPPFTTSRMSAAEASARYLLKTQAKA